MYKDLIVKRYFKIEGMTCHSCEKKIVSLCNTLPEVAAGKADFVKGHLVLELTEEPFSSGKIIKLIEDAGYSGQEISKFRKLYSDFLPV